MHATTPGFSFCFVLFWCWRSNSGYHACYISTPPAELQPRPEALQFDILQRSEFNLTLYTDYCMLISVTPIHLSHGASMPIYDWTVPRFTTLRQGYFDAILICGNYRQPSSSPGKHPDKLSPVFLCNGCFS